MFIGRNSNGTIYGAWTVRQPDDEFHQGQEELSDDDPEVLAFMSRGTDPASGEASDKRAYEELLEQFQGAVDDENTIEALRLVPQLLLLKRS